MADNKKRKLGNRAMSDATFSKSEVAALETKLKQVETDNFFLKGELCDKEAELQIAVDSIVNLKLRLKNTEKKLTDQETELKRVKASNDFFQQKLRDQETRLMETDDSIDGLRELLKSSKKKLVTEEAENKEFREFFETVREDLMNRDNYSYTYMLRFISGSTLGSNGFFDVMLEMHIDAVSESNDFNIKNDLEMLAPEWQFKALRQIGGERLDPENLREFLSFDCEADVEVVAPVFKELTGQEFKLVQDDMEEDSE